MKLKNTIKVPIMITGASLGLGIAGTAISGVNPTIGEKVSQAGQTSAGFISPAVNIAMGGYVINQLKGLKKGGRR